MAKLQTPGVYIEEMNAFPSSVVEVPTGVPIFIGHTEKATYEGKLLQGKPFSISGLADYSTHFGAGPHAANEASYQLYRAVQLFYQNGGGPCYILSVGNYQSPVLPANLLAALVTAEREQEPSLLLLPDAVALPAAHYYPIAQQMLQHCARVQSRFAIIDVPCTNQPAADIANFRAGIGLQHLKYGAAYYPNVQMADGHWQPPAGAIAGVYAYTDNQRGVWKAPANVALQGIKNLSVLLTDVQQDDMNVDGTAGISVNALRSFAGRGLLVWGARTMAGNNNEWRYVSVRRTCIMLESSVKAAIKAYVFQPNEASTWVTVKSMIDNFLNGLWRQGALAGAKPEEAYFVKVGLGTTMTANDILAGILLVEVGVAVLHPAEFIIIRYQQQMQVG